MQVSSIVFACYSATCRPPTSGGTGGSNSSGKGRPTKAGYGMGNAQGSMGQAKYVRSDGTPVSADYPGAILVKPRNPIRTSTSYVGDLKKEAHARKSFGDSPLVRLMKSDPHPDSGFAPVSKKTSGGAVNFRIGGGVGPGVKGLSINKSGELHLNYIGGPKNQANTKIGSVTKVGKKYQVEVDGKTIKATTQSGLKAAVDRAYKSKSA